LPSQILGLNFIRGQEHIRLAGPGIRNAHVILAASDVVLWLARFIDTNPNAKA
jgi:hypothetical protein